LKTKPVTKIHNEVHMLSFINIILNLVIRMRDGRRDKEFEEIPPFENVIFLLLNMSSLKEEFYETLRK
jgi:hypothetical protein